MKYSPHIHIFVVNYFWPLSTLQNRMVVFPQVKLQSDLWLMAEIKMCTALTLWHICAAIVIAGK